MKHSFSPLLCVALVSCMAPANPPSLLPRAIETEAEAAPKFAPPLAAKPISMALATKLAALVSEAKAGNNEFAKADQSGSAAIKAGRSWTPGSETWVAAELVRSALQVARQRSAAALAEIDSLAVTQGELASRGAGSDGLAEIQAAQAEIETIVARQTARMESISR